MTDRIAFSIAKKWNDIIIEGTQLSKVRPINNE
jgi:hypothetical protein